MEFTINQQKLVNEKYKKYLYMIHKAIEDNKEDELENYLNERNGYVMYDMKNRINQTIEFTAMTYAFIGYKEIAKDDSKDFLDKWIINLLISTRHVLDGIYLKKFYEWIGY